MATIEYFPGIGKIKFEGVESKNPMAFRSCRILLN